MSYDNFNRQPRFKPIDHLYESRLRQFTDGGRYVDLNLPKFYDIYREEIGNLKSYKVADDIHGKTQRPLWKDIDFDSIEWQDIGIGYRFGPSWKTFWVKFELDIPQEFLQTDGLEIQWETGSEGLLYNALGLPLQAFSNERQSYRIPQEYRKLGKQLFYVEVACNGMFGTGSDGFPDPNKYYRLNRAHLVVLNMEARKLFYDFWILGDASREFPGSWQKYQAGDLCNEIMNVFDPQDSESIKACRELAKKMLGDKIDSEEVFDTFPYQNKRIDVFAVGNCHIDTAWEWPFAETKRKIVRSWTTQLKIADEYPEYVFVASQMQQFKWLKQYHPEILTKIKEKFTTNQFLPIGGSWVENDTNVPNGESLIRQFLVGQRFQMNEFGFYSNIFWLPDTFGYSSQIPQICQISGVSRFLTQKLSWNNINTFPLSTFNWKAIDGTQVLVHMPPANTYTASAHFGDVWRSSHQHKNLRDVPAGLLLYGHGDGGGGPTEEMLEKLRRCRGLSNTIGLMPTVQLGVTVDDFYDHVLENSNYGQKLPTWSGEIYLEFHRGTYTTQALVKKYMRKGEIILHDLEYIAGFVSIKFPNKYKYPAKQISDLWEDLLLCQFHDVLPGSCIGEVYYEEVHPMLESLLKKAGNLIDDALNHCGKPKNVEEVSLVNTLPWDRTNEIVHVTKHESPDLYQLLQNKDIGINTDNARIISVNSVGGETSINKAEHLEYPASITQHHDKSFILSNKLLTAKISPTGIVTSLYDEVNHREIIDSTPTDQTTSEFIGGNQFVLFDDEPLNWPAWDTELHSLQKFKLLNNGETQILTSNELESSILVIHRLSNQSSINTVISLAGIKTKNNLENNFLKFSSKVSWHENNLFLKVQFPTTIFTPPTANYETQFGITTRPTHYNTTWDVAKFEVPHHKFMDLSEFNYGVSILNNCKYGGAIHGNLIRLSLLRSAKAPDDRADMGDYHEFEYAIYPHAGNLGESTVRAGYNFNYKLLNKPIANSGLFNSVKLEGGKSLVLSHIKRGENDYDVNQFEVYKTETPEKSLVLRVYESLGGSSAGRLVFDKSLKVDKVFKTCALEIHREELKVEDGSVDISLRAFEIATFKVYLK
ncbi:Alpha-mannosidase [Spathaspora sp. JA1]|nr:Alpha-mannosidase [Spathaspora sp. JA1]